MYRTKLTRFGTVLCGLINYKRSISHNFTKITHNFAGPTVSFDLGGEATKNDLLQQLNSARCESLLTKASNHSVVSWQFSKLTQSFTQTLCVSQSTEDKRQFLFFVGSPRLELNLLRVHKLGPSNWIPANLDVAKTLLLTCLNTSPKTYRNKKL